MMVPWALLGAEKIDAPLPDDCLVKHGNLLMNVGFENKAQPASFEVMRGASPESADPYRGSCWGVS
jgi:hypothetical protein